MLESLSLYPQPLLGIAVFVLSAWTLSERRHAELFALMTCGMATIAGTVMVLYASILAEVLPDAMGHILTASLISAPAAPLVAAIMVPPKDRGTAGGNRESRTEIHYCRVDRDIDDWRRGRFGNLS